MIERAVSQRVDEFEILFSDENPNGEEVSAVFAVVFNGNLVLAVKNERGWDIPGGHLNDANESPPQALKREVWEEAAVSLKKIRPFAQVFPLHPSAPNYEGKRMLFYSAELGETRTFPQGAMGWQRDFMTPDELLQNYGGGHKKLAEAIISHAVSKRNPPQPCSPNF